jgi:Uma2 family endonuclease
MSIQTASYIDAIEHLPKGKGAVLRIPQVSWEDYEHLLADLGDDYHVRVSYACGWLEIMSPLPEHEEFADVVLGITREITRELGVKLEARGSMTIRSAWQAQGAEPDTCFYVQNAARIIGKRSLDFNTDPPPDIVVEIDITNASHSKFPIYAALGVPEIWRYDGGQAYFYHLAGEQYVEMSHSQAFPFLATTVLAQFIEQSKTAGQDAALDAAREWVRVNKPTGNG